MSKTTFNYWLDFLLLVIFVALIWVSVVTRFVFPPPSRASGWLLWGGTFEQWQTIQFGLLCAMSGAVLLHLMMHWSWVCAVTAGGVAKLRGEKKKQKVDEGMQTIYGVGALIVIVNLVGFAIAAAVLTIQSPT